MEIVSDISLVRNALFGSIYFKVTDKVIGRLENLVPEEGFLLPALSQLDSFFVNWNKSDLSGIVDAGILTRLLYAKRYEIEESDLFSFFEKYYNLSLNDFFNNAITANTDLFDDYFACLFKIDRNIHLACIYQNNFFCDLIIDYDKFVHEYVNLREKVDALKDSSI